MASLKDAKDLIKSWHPNGWGELLEILNNKNCSRLGYNSEDLKKATPIAVKGQGLPLSDFFSSAKHLVDGHMRALEEDDELEEEGLIYQKT